MTKRRWSILLPAFVVLIVASLLPFAVSAAPPQDAAAGHTTWDAKLCKNCHGPAGEGKYALPLAGTALTAADAIKQVRAPRGQMPMFAANQVSDQEITDMIDYMHTLAKPASFTPVRYEAKADDPPGKVIFMQKRCVACHGEDFVNTAPFIVRSGRTTLTRADVEKQIRNPRMLMPHFSTTQVTDADIDALTPYLNAAVVKAASGAAAAPAAQATPAALPTTGGDPMSLPMFASLLGLATVAVGLALRRVRR